MILLRQKYYSKKDIAKVIIGTTLAGGMIGREVGNKIGEKKGKRDYLNNFNPAEEEKDLKDFIRSEKRRLRKAKRGELDDSDFDYHNFMNSPEEIAENIEHTKRKVEKLRNDPDEYAKNKSEQPWNYTVRDTRKSHRRLGTKLGLGLGAGTGAALVLAKKFLKK